MNEDIQSGVLLLLIGCIMMLAAINIYLVLQQMKGSHGAVVASPVPTPAAAPNPATTAQFERIAAQLQALQAALDELKAAPENHEPEVDTNSLFKLDSELSESLAELEQADGGSEALLLDLQQADAAGLSAWRDFNADRIAGLVAQQKQLRGRIASLQNLLSDANATILTLRSRTPRRNFVSGGDAGNDGNLVSELQQARKNAARLTSELSAANANVQMLNERVATRELMLAEASEQHEKERADLDKQIAELKTKVQSMQASFDRTLVEKNFIEEAFLDEIEGEKKA